jgi:ATP synthase protein I
VARVEPERELVRRALPFVPPAVVLAFAIGLAGGGAGPAWSAAIGVAVVAGNFVSSALSISWAGAISPAAVAAVALGGFFLRIVVLVVALVLLNTLAWFSPVAFALAVVPSTAALLAFEIRLLFGRMQVELWSFEAPR